MHRNSNPSAASERLNLNNPAQAKRSVGAESISPSGVLEGRDLHRVSYTPPQLTVAECRPERGYAVSDWVQQNTRELELNIILDQENQQRETEDFNPHTIWTEENPESFWL